MTRRRKTLIVSTTGLVGVGALIAGVLAFVQWAEPFWEGEPYPVARPAATAERLDGHTQSVYDALGLRRARLDDKWPGQGLEAKGSACHRRGLQHRLDEFNDTPPSEPHVVDMRESWALKGVSRAQAKPALERVRQKLTRQGWKVTLSEDSQYGLQLSLKHPGTGDVLSMGTYPEDRLDVSAHAACARY
ncbi:hypothetical protein, partial [Streptomyces thioluteus]|uniref:hypothetical protein n=1 Tax=Streptomyces thioluteus TaxID=66431 RepID=UPI0031EB26E0